MSEISMYEAQKKKMEGLCEEHDLTYQKTRVMFDTFTGRILPESHSTRNVGNHSSQTRKRRPARNGAAETNKPKMNLRKSRRPILNCARISSKSFRTAYSNST